MSGARYHIDPKTGSAGPCTATERPCKYTVDGVEAPHFASKRDALDFYESSMASKLIPEQIELPKTSVLPEDVQHIKKPYGRRPEHGVPCPNRKCDTSYHDLRSMKPYSRCLKEVSYLVSKDTVEHLALEFHRLAKEYREGRYAENLEENYETLLKSNYAETGNRMAALMLMSYYRSQRELYTFGKSMDSWNIRELAVKWQKMPESIRLPYEAEHAESIKAEIADYHPALREQLKVTQAGAALAKKKINVTASTGEKEPAQMSLGEIFQYRDQQKALSEQSRDVTKTLKKRWWEKSPRTFTETLPPEATEGYNKINKFIGSLPPHSKEIFHLYEAILDDPNLDTPETRKRINEEFREAYAEESAMLSKATTPMETVEMMLEGIRGKGKPEPKSELDQKVLPPAAGANESLMEVRWPGSSPSPEDARSVDQHAALRED